MLTGILFFVACVVVALWMVGKVDTALKKRHSHLESLNWWVIFSLFLAIAFGIPAMVANLVEFPTLIGKPTVATFDNNGNLIYHRWGLYTPPGREVVNARIGDSWSLMGRMQKSIPIYIEKDGWVVEMRFSLKLTLTDPKEFFSQRGRRNQKINPETELGPRIIKDFVFFVFTNHNKIEEGLISCIRVNRGEVETNACDKFENVVGESLTTLYEYQGVKITSRLWSGERWKP